jgi:hypothetical protein
MDVTNVLVQSPMFRRVSQLDFNALWPLHFVSEIHWEDGVHPTGLRLQLTSDPTSHHFSRPSP